MMPQTVNTPILISVPNVEMQAWNNAVFSRNKGIAMHNGWASYWNYPDIQHAVCCAHLLRELTGIDENHPEGMSAHDIKLMSDNDLLDMDYFLHEFDDDDDFGEEGFYLF